MCSTCLRRHNINPVVIDDVWATYRPKNTIYVHPPENLLDLLISAKQLLHMLVTLSPPFKRGGWGGKNWNIPKRGRVTPHHLEIFQTKISGLASGGPPPPLLEAQKIRGGGIFHVVRWNISQLRNFWSNPPKYSRDKGGGVMLVTSYGSHMIAPPLCKLGHPTRSSMCLASMTLGKRCLLLL